MPLPETLHLEGYLFPSTYRLPPGTGAEQAIRTMLRATRQQVYLPYRQAMEQRGLSLHELLTIASMIEKEVLHDDERPRVASVIYNRLRINMPLQIDATVLYGMGYWKERVLYKDLRHGRRTTPIAIADCRPTHRQSGAGKHSRRARARADRLPVLCGAGERLPPLLAHLHGASASDSRIRGR